jgi:peroxin-4
VNFKVRPSLRFSPSYQHLLTTPCQTGEICLDLLKTNWSPAYTISTTLTSINQLLTSAEPDSPLNIDIAQLFRQGDYVGAEALIRFYTDSERWEGR